MDTILSFHKWPVSALATSLEAAMKLHGSIGWGLSRPRSSAGHFFFSQATFFPLAPEDPVTAYCYWVRSGVGAGSLDLRECGGLLWSLTYLQPQKEKRGQEIQGCYKNSKYYHTKCSPELSGTSTISMYIVDRRSNFLSIPSVWSWDQAHSYFRSSQIVWHLARLSSLRRNLGLWTTKKILSVRKAEPSDHRLHWSWRRLLKVLTWSAEAAPNMDLERKKVTVLLVTKTLLNLGNSLKSLGRSLHEVVEFLVALVGL